MSLAKAKAKNRQENAVFAVCKNTHGLAWHGLVGRNTKNTKGIAKNNIKSVYLLCTKFRGKCIYITPYIPCSASKFFTIIRHSHFRHKLSLLRTKAYYSVYDIFCLSSFCCRIYSIFSFVYVVLFLILSRTGIVRVRVCEYLHILYIYFVHTFTKATNSELRQMLY